MGIDASKVETDLAAMLEAEVSQSPVKALQPILENAVEFETNAYSRLEFSPDEFELLARAYRIPRLMLDPLIAEWRRVPCVVSRHDGDGNDLTKIPVSRFSKSTYGQNANYRVPAQRLFGTTDLGIVLLELKSGGRSDTHSHPGDEFMYVMDGEIEVQMEETGLSVRVRQGEFIHFYAEQRHAAWNPSNETARVFVIRFYALVDSEDPEREVYAKTIAQPYKEWSSGFAHRVSTEMGLSLMRYRDKVHSYTGDTTDELPSEVEDRIGLGRLLELSTKGKHNKDGINISLSSLAASSRNRSLNYSRSKFDRIHQGRSPVPTNELKELASVYELEPVLLYHYLASSHRSAISVRDHNESEDHRVNDWWEVPKSAIHVSGARYWIPKRKLADTSITVARLLLGSGSSSPDNSHPGNEILLPLSGEFNVCFGDAKIDLREGQFAHYHSTVSHRVDNVGKEKSEMLVIRIYE